MPGDEHRRLELSIPGKLEKLQAGRLRLSQSVTHCPRQHPYDETNNYRDPKGKRRCKVCRREDMRAKAKK